MQRSSPTLLFKLPTHASPTLYLLPLYPSYTIMSLAAFLHLLFPLPLLICSWFFNGMPKAFETGVLNYHTSYCFIWRILSVFRNPTVTHPYSFRIPGFYALQLDRTHSRTGILSFNDPHASDGIIIFARQGLSFSELSMFSLSSHGPYCELFLALFLMYMLLLFAFLRRIAKPTPFSPPEIFLFWVFNRHYHLWDSKSISDPRREEVFD